MNCLKTLSKSKKISIFFWIASVLWTAFIFSNSLQNGVASGEMSGSVTDFINDILQAISPSFEVTHYFVRKAAHFGEFAILSFILCLAICFWDFPKRTLKREYSCLLAVPIAAVVASCDECIQLFVDGRGASIVDVGIDAFGALTAALCFLALMLIIKAKRSAD